jgi:hypothetical protein
MGEAVRDPPGVVSNVRLEFAVKQISFTRVVVTGLSPERVTDLAGRLRMIGLDNVSSRCAATGGPIELAGQPTVVVMDSLDGSVPACPIEKADLADRRAVAVLLVPTPSHTLIKLASAAGYAALLPSETPTRTLYRRIGALMQKIRRPERVAPPAMEPANPDAVRAE